MKAVDLFAGLGGWTEGAKQASVRVQWSGNHWPAAVYNHQQNHPEVEHVCQDLRQANWTLLPLHDLLLASPSCQGFSPARGKDRPRHDAERATAWAVVDAVECCRPAFFAVENVPEFARWVLYPAWTAAMNALGYALRPYLVDAADHGVPQNRIRLIVVGSKSKHPIEIDLPKRAHVGAESFVDFGAGQWSRVADKAPNTIRRIRSGRASHGDRFVMPYYGSGSGLTGRCLSRPIGTITTKDRWGVVDGDRMRMLSVPEAKQAMGFPTHYRLPEQRVPAMRMLGNAVPPTVARDFVHALKEAA